MAEKCEQAASHSGIVVHCSTAVHVAWLLLPVPELLPLPELQLVPTLLPTPKLPPMPRLLLAPGLLPMPRLPPGPTLAPRIKFGFARAARPGYLGCAQAHGCDGLTPKPQSDAATSRCLLEPPLICCLRR